MAALSLAAASRWKEFRRLLISPRLLCTSVMIGTSLAAIAPAAHSSELVTLRNGFDVVCDHRDAVGTRVRLYLSPGPSNFVEFPSAEIAAIQPGPAPAPSGLAINNGQSVSAIPEKTTLTPAELHEMLASAGAQHHIDVDLLASVVHAESGGNVRAVSRTGARGLMQLMPGTAAGLGVSDSFRAEENIRGGAAYLDTLLTKYSDNLALALAAYNSGPGAVARWHGIPPYRETRAYVARVIREFNARRPSSFPPRNAANSIAAAVTPLVATQGASSQ